MSNLEENGVWLQLVCALVIALFPGLPTVQFLMACSMRNGGGRPGPFFHVNDMKGGRSFRLYFAH